MNTEITFVGGPLDRQRVVTDEPAPGYWTYADTSKLGPQTLPPARPELIEIKTVTYKIHPIRQNYKTYYIGLVLEQY